MITTYKFFFTQENLTFKIVEQTPSMVVVETESKVSSFDEVGETIVCVT